MTEQLHGRTPEREPRIDSPEAKKQLEQLAEKLRTKAENSPEKFQAEEAREARTEAQHEAISGAEKGPSSEKQKTHQVIHPHHKQQTYKATMRRVESKLPGYQKAFSRIVNQPTIDQISGVAAKTVARPSGIIGGGVASVIVLSLVTFYANSLGFPISGSEFILSLFIGWIIGLSIEGLGKLVHRN